MGSLIQQIKDGKIVDNSSTTSSDKKSKADTTKDMFLKLLVTEMQYQDPLEPTTNSDYVSEMATFSQVESLENVSSQMDTLSSNSLVGKYVNLTDDAGKEISGKVDFVKTTDGVTYASVNDVMYKVTSITSVADTDYYEAVYAASSLSDMLKKMPAVDKLTTKSADALSTIRTLYDAMSTYQKQFVSADNVKSLEALENRMKVLKAAEASANTTDSSATTPTVATPTT